MRGSYAPLNNESVIERERERVKKEKKANEKAERSPVFTLMDNKMRAPGSNTVFI